MFPFFTSLAEYGSPDMSIVYLGTESVRGALAHRIELKRPSQPRDVFVPAREQATRIVVAISTSSYLPLKIESLKLATRNATASLPATCYLSDFRMVGLKMVPFHLEEFAGEHRLFSLQLDSVQINVGLSDAEFSVP